MGQKHEKIDNLIDIILKLKGSKIITLSCEDFIDPSKTFKIDVTEDGFFGYDTNHFHLFKDKLAQALNSRGGMIIRQFTREFVKRIGLDGKLMRIPRKNIYGVSFSDKEWFPLSKEEVEKLCCVDYKTGESIPPEDLVSYCDFPLKWIVDIVIDELFEY